MQNKLDIIKILVNHKDINLNKKDTISIARLNKILSAFFTVKSYAFIQKTYRFNE